MVSPDSYLEQLSSAMEQSQSGMSVVSGTGSSAAFADGLNQVAQELKSNRGQLLVECKKDARQSEATNARAKANLKQQKAAQVKPAAKGDSGPAAVAVPAEPGSEIPEPLDPELGQKLRGELLQHFGSLPAPNAKNRSGKESDYDWNDWT